MQLIQAECESVLSHCVELEESCTSSIYHSAVVSDDVVPAGVFLIILRDAIESTIKIPSNSDQMQQLVGESTAALIHLVLNTRVERDYIIDDRKDGLLSVDGPQCLAFIEYIQVTLSSQQAVFNLTGSIFMKQVDLDYNSIVGGHSDVSLIDGTIICATLLRAANPWTIEFFPNVFKSLFQACDNSVESLNDSLRS